MKHVQTIALARDLLARGRAGDAVRMVEPLIGGDNESQQRPDPAEAVLRALYARAAITEYGRPRRARDVLTPIGDADGRASLPPPARGEAALWLGWSYACHDVETYDGARALFLFEEAASSFGACADPYGLCWTSLGRAQAFLLLDELTLMRRELDNARRCLDQLDDKPARRSCAELRLLASRAGGHNKAAADALDTLESTAANSGSPFVRGKESAYRMTLLDDRGADSETLIEAAQQAEQLLGVESVAPGYALLIAYRTHLDALVRAGRWNAVDPLVDRALRHVRDLPSSPSLLLPRARVALRQGRFDDALSVLDVADDRTPGVQHRLLTAEIALARARCHRLSGDPDRALWQADRARRAAETTGHHVRHVETLLLGAALYLDREDKQAARDLLASASGFTGAFQSLPLHAARSELQARLALADGERDHGAMLLESALSAYTLLGDVYHSERLRLALAQQTGSATQSCIEQARDTFDRLGARPDYAEATSMLESIQDDGSPAPSRLHDLGQQLVHAAPSPVLVAETWLQAAAEMLPARWIAVYRKDADGTSHLIRRHGAREDVPPPHEADGVRWLNLGSLAGTATYYFAAEVGDEAAWQATVAHLSPWAATAVLALNDAAHVNENEPVPQQPAGRRDPAVQTVVRRSDHLREAHSPLLIHGETGTCKQKVATALHNGNAPFVVVDCTEATYERMERHLFGVDGAERPGLVREADGGTLFFRDIDRLPRDLHPHVLRLVEDGEVIPSEATRPIQVDVRIMASTSTDLAEEVGRGRFMEELYVRLAMLTLHVPPLRERRTEIGVLAHHFINVGRSENAQAMTLTQPALQALLSYDWPGNVRQLRHEMEAARDRVRHEPAPTVGLIDLSSALREAAASARWNRTPAPAPDDRPLDAVLADVERSLIREALDRHDGRVTATAEALGLTRQGLYKKIKRLDIDSTKSSNNTARTTASSSH